MNTLKQFPFFFFLLIVDYTQNSLPLTQGFESSRESRAQADLKFTYVVSCQIYGQQKQRKAAEAADISLLLQRCAFHFGYLSFESTCLVLFVA